MLNDFGPVAAHALTDQQRDLVAALFGSGILPEDSSVELHHGNLIIEHFNLDRFLDLCPDLHPHLIGSGRLHYPISTTSNERGKGEKS